MIHLFALFLLLVCVAGMVSGPPTPEMINNLRQFIRAGFINEAPIDFEKAIEDTLSKAGISLFKDRHAIFWKEYQALQMEWTLGPSMRIGEVFPLCVRDDINAYFGLHLDVWIRIFKLLDPKELEMLESVCKYFHTILKDQISFCYIYSDVEDDIAKDISGSEDLKLLGECEGKYTAYDVRCFVNFASSLNLIFPRAFTYCTRSDGSMFFLYQHQRGHANFPFALLMPGKLKVNTRFEKYIFSLIKEHILENIKSAQEFHPTKLYTLNFGMYYIQKCLEVLCSIAEVLIDDSHVESQVIQNFLNECFNYRETIYYFSPLNPRILVLISRLSDNHNIDNLNNLRDLGGDVWKFNNSCALINGCCRSNLISKEMRRRFIGKLIGLNIDLDDPELLIKLTSIFISVLHRRIGSNHIVDFIPVDLYSQVLKLGYGYSDLGRVRFVISIDKLEEFLLGKGIFYESEIMFKYITTSLDAFLEWPIYVDWAIYKISKDMINMDDKKIVELILSILQHIKKYFSAEVKRAVMKFGINVLTKYPDLISNASKKTLELATYYYYD